MPVLLPVDGSQALGSAYLVVLGSGWVTPPSGSGLPRGISPRCASVLCTSVRFASCPVSSAAEPRACPRPGELSAGSGMGLVAGLELTLPHQSFLPGRCRQSWLPPMSGTVMFSPSRLLRICFFLCSKRLPSSQGLKILSLN